MTRASRVTLHMVAMSEMCTCLKYDEICIEEKRQDRDGLLVHNDAVQLMMRFKKDFCRPPRLL